MMTDAPELPFGDPGPLWNRHETFARAGDKAPRSTATLSTCERYRYRLTRQCPGDGATLVIMVNPSTADAHRDDATIRKLLGFGQRHDWGLMMVGNLFAFRATNVRDLASARDPVGPDNDRHLADMAAQADRLVFAWGPVAKVPRSHRDRWWRIIDLMPTGLEPVSIGPVTKCGHPRHPLMLAYSEPLTPWSPPE